ncbi:DMT family transporter [Caballeronia sp. LZ062]|uniref:DMT family transporter n=1 Tax=unclassified Caballeronia TaxID=2646786 RepID=UPI00285EB3E4|nr:MULTISPECIES: DMT family transporter [unclassified Caballeronia]MDR5857573.1 DMT family transporter [Caballeronia sp. LZ050]MDR5869123.1 DMT family transporter [Caballeronia sp. LZ062]
MATLEGKTRFSIGTETTGAGIAVMILTTAAFAASDSTVKLIGAAVPIVALLWVRYLFQMIVLGVWQAQRGAFGLFRTFRTGTLKLQVVRALLLLANSACTFAGLRYLPLPVTTSLAMLAPLISTLLAALVLKDHVSRSKWAMVVLGFIGMLLIVRPGGSDFTWTVILPIGSATTFACFQVVSSHLSRVDDAITTNFLTALVATLVLCALVWADQARLLPELARVGVGSWLLVAFMATMATGGQLLMLQALRRAPLSVLMPFSYAQLAFASCFSWLLFGQAPDAWMTAGMCVIAASGIGTVLMHGRKAAEAT